MDDEEFMNHLGNQARQERRDFARWYQSTDQNGHPADAPESDVRKALLAPLSSAEMQRLVCRTETHARKPGPAKLLSIPRSRWVGKGVAALALAAGLALMIRPSTTSPPLLPSYELSVTGGDTATRADHETAKGPVVLHRGASFDLVLRPDRTYDAPLEVRLWLDYGAQPRAWTPPVEISPQGAVRILPSKQQVQALPEGPVTLFVAVGAKGSLPDDPASIAKHPNTRVLRLALDVRP